ncbi:5-demethoxyubiquinol-8 5-hydroxylase UbiM [Paucibacter soli]|uniref:5-demethoxyubiquinol-8 5-hydroxylase UbiM n=1 Tax=Paucibacter soli TaxID=3133433 RepID=UPI0030B7A5B1
MHEEQPQVLIIGAGPAGLSMAAALADVGLASTVLEQAPLAQIADPAEDGREIALTHRGMAVLQALGAWQDLPPEQISPLKRAHVFDGNAPSFLGFDPGSGGADAEQLGALVPNHWLRRIAYQGAQRRAGLISLRCEARMRSLSLQQADAASVTLESGETLQAPLLIAADSRFSNARRLAGIGAEMRDFGRGVIVCRMAHDEVDHQATALECFHYGHTMAWLPLNGRMSSLVLTMDSQPLQELLAWDEARFTAWVQEHSLGRLGRLRLLGPRHHYPLVATYAHRFAAPRFALIGDAAVGMHPVTAHGYNFGLYGVQTLAALLKGAADPGDAALLQRYAAEHRRATWPIYQGTNAVVKLFTDERPGARLLRRGVLTLAGRLPPLKAAISAQLTGKPWLPFSRP